MRSLKQRQRVFPHVPFGHLLENSLQPANSSHQQPTTAENTPMDGTTNTVHNNMQLEIWRRNECRSESLLCYEKDKTETRAVRKLY